MRVATAVGACAERTIVHVMKTRLQLYFFTCTSRVLTLLAAIAAKNVGVEAASAGKRPINDPDMAQVFSLQGRILSPLQSRENPSH